MQNLIFTFCRMTLDGGEVCMELILAVGEFSVPRLLHVSVVWKRDPLPSCDLAVYHEAQRIQDVALKSLEAACRTHRPKLYAILHDHCIYE